MSKAALADAAGLGLRSIVAWEAGETEPTDESVELIATVLRFPVAFFGAGEIEEPDPEGASFRAFSSMTAGQRDAALGAGTLAMEIGRWIDARFELPHPDLPDLVRFAPEAAAQALRLHWNLGERPIRNMIHLLESHGVRVFSLPTDCAGVDAFSVWTREVPHMFLTTVKSGERGRFDAAHELAHLVMHRRGGPRGRQSEVDADTFASAFLMPQSSLYAKAPRCPNLGTLITLKKNWSVSVAALTHRLRSLGRLTEWQYRMLCIEMAKRGYRKQEPEGISHETSQVMSKVFGALRGEGVTGPSIAKELAIHPAELGELVFGAVMVPVSGGRQDSRPRVGGRGKLRLATHDGDPPARRA